MTDSARDNEYLDLLNKNKPGLDLYFTGLKDDIVSGMETFEQKWMKKNFVGSRKNRKIWNNPVFWTALTGVAAAAGLLLTIKGC